MFGRYVTATIAALLVLGAAVLTWILWPLAPVVLATSALVAGPLVANEPVQPIPLLAREDPGKLALGRRLFNDQRLSGDESVACASCHDLKGGGADARGQSIGVGGQVVPLNTPTVFNSSFNHRQYWDARAADLPNQVISAVMDPLLMGATWSVVIDKLAADADYRQEFARLYPGEGLNAITVADALAAYERTLVTPDSAFDRWLRGETAAISEEAKQGYSRFKELGCVACHQGVNLGGNMISGLGVLGDYFADRGRVEQKGDLGRFNVTGREEDRHMFKVPGLRNVAKTAPYFHDGAVATLDEAVELMARYQLGIRLPQADQKAIIAFLKTLDGKLPE